MNADHYSELITLSQEIHNRAADRISNYLAAEYCGVGSSSAEQQLEDYLFIAERVCACFLGSALALLDTGTQEAEIRAFTDKLRRTVTCIRQKAGEDIRSC